MNDPDINTFPMTLEGHEMAVSCNLEICQERQSQMTLPSFSGNQDGFTFIVRSRHVYPLLFAGVNF
jgi:hypothetical protein